MENQTPEVVVPQQQKFNPILWIVIGVAILAVGIGVGLVFGKYSSKQNQLSTQPVVFSPTSFPATTPTETTDHTANWKTYTNTQYKFEFKYPSSWDGPMRISGTSEQGSVSFQGIEGSINLTWGGGFGGGNCPQKVQIIPSEIGNMGFCPIQGSETFKTANEGPWPQGAQYLNIMFSVNTPVTQNRQVLDQILSTFKFTQ